MNVDLFDFRFLILYFYVPVVDLRLEKPGINLMKSIGGFIKDFSCIVRLFLFSFEHLHSLLYSSNHNLYISFNSSFIIQVSIRLSRKGKALQIIWNTQNSRNNKKTKRRNLHYYVGLWKVCLSLSIKNKHWLCPINPTTSARNGKYLEWHMLRHCKRKRF